MARAADPFSGNYDNDRQGDDDGDALDNVPGGRLEQGADQELRQARGSILDSTNSRRNRHVFFLRKQNVSNH